MENMFFVKASSLKTSLKSFVLRPTNVLGSSRVAGIASIE